MLAPTQLAKISQIKVNHLLIPGSQCVTQMTALKISAKESLRSRKRNKLNREPARKQIAKKPLINVLLVASAFTWCESQ